MFRVSPIGSERAFHLDPTLHKIVGYGKPYLVIDLVGIARVCHEIGILRPAVTEFALNDGRVATVQSVVLARSGCEHDLFLRPTPFPVFFPGTLAADDVILNHAGQNVCAVVDISRILIGL